MASPTAFAPHSGPVDQPGEGAYIYARSGIARSATTRSNFVAMRTTIDWIVRDNNGTIISTTDISGIVLLHTLNVTQAINDEPDTCSLTLKPQDAPALVPQVGQEIRIQWAPGGPPLFHGYIVTAQSDWRLLNEQPPWIALQCQDAMWRFDARIVTHRFPNQSVSASIALLVNYWCNVAPDTPTHPLNFNLTNVQPNMPTIPAFDMVNQRPSTVMRTLMQAVAGAFYIDGFAVHAWAGSVSEPNQTSPQPLTVGLKTLHAFRRTDDATQVRRGVIVEGRRTQTLIGVPTTTAANTTALGLPLQDVSLFSVNTGPDIINQVRVGTVWAEMRDARGPLVSNKNPTQGRVRLAFTPGQTILEMDPVAVMPGPNGWVRVGNQYARYNSINGAPLTNIWQIVMPASAPYGVFTEAIGIGATVEWVEGVMQMYPRGVTWEGADLFPDGDLMATQPTDTPVVVLAQQQIPHGQWPPLEGFVQDGRYSYAGADARASADLAAFKDPLVSVEWETDDLNAIPGRSQVIALTSAVVTPPINTTVTILRVEMTFPLRTLPPRRQCTGGIVKPSTFMDLVVTANN